MPLYETIFSRRTVKNFDMAPLDHNILQDVLSFVNHTNQIGGQTAQFQIAAAGEVSDKTAPHYLLAYCADNDAAYANVGYVMANAELYLQSKGYGSHWLAMAKPNHNKKEFCILLAFGRTDEPERKGLDEFKRLPVAKISNADNSIINAARLAPSAMNKQPWKIVFSDGTINICTASRGLVDALLPAKWSKIDLGIITRYLQIASENEGKQVYEIKVSGTGKAFRIDMLFRNRTA